MKSKNTTCVSCGKAPKKVTTRGKVLSRCASCHKEFKRLEMRRLRRKWRLEKINAGVDNTIRKICTKCLHSKLHSEFSTNRKDGGRSNKLCDACLTAVYLSPSRRTLGFDEVWWRQRAYTCNTAYRNLVAAQRAVSVTTIRTKDLDYVCKPQDLIALFDAQNGLCAYCSVELLPDNTTVDHATPKSKGGAHRPVNFRIACGDCNRLKHTRDSDEFEKFVKRYCRRFK